MRTRSLVRVATTDGRSPAAAVPLAQLRLQLGGRGELQRVRQLQVLRNFAALAERLETLAAAQGLAELDFVGVNSPARGDFKLSFDPALTGYFEIAHVAS